MAELIPSLEERGFLEQLSAENLADFLATNKVPVYAGFDPTADSLHLGHLVPVMSLLHAQQSGHKPIVLVGGATAMIGDPSGKSAERNLLSSEQIEANLAGVKNQLEKIMDFDGPSGAEIVNNLDWIGKFSYIEWLRDIGKHFTLAVMTAKESVKKRMADSSAGISYTEFSYQLLQAYDFLHLYKQYGCRLQVGGSDQWGNITAGIDLVRRKEAAEVFGMTHPLLTTAKGEKFGKTAGNAVWLDKTKTSVWDFYQYWVNAGDEDVVRYLKLFTFMPLEEIAALEKETADNPGARAAQKALAQAATSFFHSSSEAQRCVDAAAALFKGSLVDLPTDLIKDVLASSLSLQISRDELNGGLTLLKAGVNAGLFPSAGEGKRKIKSGAFYLNDQRVEADRPLDGTDILKDDIALLRMGKKKYALLVIN